MITLTRATHRLPANALTAILLTLVITACSDQEESRQINEPRINQLVKEINQAHNQGTLNMSQLGEHYQVLNRYTDGLQLTQGIGALGAFYAENLGEIYRTFVTLEEPEAFLIIHTTVRTGDAYTENTGAFTGENTLAALKQHQRGLMLRYDN